MREPDIRNTRTIRFRTPELFSGVATLHIVNRGGLAQAPVRILPPPVTNLPDGAITTFAGGTSSAGEGLSATNVGISPTDVDLDASGNTLISETQNSRIRKVSSLTGLIFTIAGNGSPEFTGDKGLAILAGLNKPSAIAVDRDGGILIADTWNHRIRKIQPNGIITTLAGLGAPLFSGDGGPASKAGLAKPRGLAVNRDGHLYISDSGNSRIRFIDRMTGLISTIAGTGEGGFSGDGGPSELAQLSSPRRIHIDRDGNLYIADTGNQRVRRIDGETGLITTVAGNGETGPVQDQVPATETPLDTPVAVFVSPKGRIWIADRGHHRIRRVDTDGIIETMAGSTEGFAGEGEEASQALFSNPSDLVHDASGNLYISDAGNHRVRKVVAKTTRIRTIAGTGEPVGVADGLPAQLTRFNVPSAIVQHPNGDFFISDTGHHRVRRISATTGLTSTVAGTGIEGFSGDGGPASEALLAAPFGLALDALGNLLIADTENRRIRRFNIDDGTIQTLTGPNGTETSGGNLPLTAPLMAPRGVFVSPNGDILVADSAAHRIIRIRLDPPGVSVVAGNGQGSFSGDGGPAQQASLLRPTAVGVDSSGNLLISDPGNHVVRKVAAVSQIIITLAGTGIPGFSGDGGPADQAQLRGPAGLAEDANGNLYISDTLNHRVRRIDPRTGIITTVVGSGRVTPLGDGGPAGAAGLSRPLGLLFGGNNLLIVDALHGRIRVVKGVAQ